MSSGPLTAIGASIYGTGVAPNVGYPNGSYGAAPLSHAGMFSRARSNCCLSLLNSLYTLRGMPMTDRLERRGGLFLDSASTLFFGGVRSGSEEMPKDNLSSGAASQSSDRIDSLPLFCLTGGGVQGGYSLVHFLSICLPDEPAGGRFPTTDGQHDSVTRSFVWPVPPTLPPYLGANEGIGLLRIDSLGCWSW